VMHFSNSAPAFRFITNICVVGGPCNDAMEGNVTDGYFKWQAIAGLKAVRVRMTARGGADSVTATFGGSGVATGDTLGVAAWGAVAHNGIDNTVAVNSPPLKAGGSAYFSGTQPTYATLPTPVSGTGRIANISTSAYGHVNTQVPTRPLTQTITANSVSRDFSLEGVNSWGLAYSGTWTGTVAIEISDDNAGSFVPWIMWNASTGQNTDITIVCASTCSGNLRPLYFSGFTHLRIRSTAWTSGTLALDFVGSQQAPDFIVADVVGNVTSGTADAGNPISTGAMATNAISGLTPVDNLDRVKVIADTSGRPITMLGCNVEDIVTGVDTDTDGSSTAGIAAQAAGIRVLIYGVIIANTSSTMATVDLRDGTGGAVKATIPAPATSGAVTMLPVPVPFTAATAVAVDPSAGLSTITTTLIGCKSK
jgi:hypothetical protein